MNNPLIFQHIKSSPTGENSTSGRQMERAFNNNFDLLAAYLPQIAAAISIGITSDKMKQIKVDTSTTPHKIYYTLDTEDNPNPTWIKLVDLQFSDIEGNPLDNITLKEALDTKAKQTDLDSLEDRVTTAESDIDSNTNDINDLKDKTSKNKLQIDKNTDLLSHAVINDDTTQMLFKFDPVKSELKLSVDNGATWLLINDINTGFGHVVGNVTDNQALVDYITQRLNSYTLETTFNNHAGDTSNPHGVTKKQIGLDRVQNLAPAEMPISNPQELRFKSIERTRKETITISISDYKSSTINSQKLYFITSHADDLNDMTN